MLMKNNGAAAKVGGDMLKGTIPFDAVTAQLVLRTLNSSAIGFGHLFPDGSQTGNKTRAAAAIWSDRAGFDQIVAKMVQDTSVTVTDMDGFKAAFGTIGGNCASCHKAYRTEAQ